MSWSREELEYYHSIGRISDMSYYQQANKPWWIVWNERMLNNEQHYKDYREYKEQLYRKDMEEKRIKKEQEAKQKQLEEEVIKVIEKKLPNILQKALDNLL